MTCSMSQKLLRKLHENDSLNGCSSNSMEFKLIKVQGTVTSHLSTPIPKCWLTSFCDFFFCFVCLFHFFKA